MKKLCYLLLSFTLFVSGIQAQDCNDVTITAVATPSNCMSSGSITITWSGASVGNLVGKQYSLKSTTGALAIGPVSTNVFNNIPPGNYNLEAAAFCGSLAGQEIVRTINNVTVTGSYQEPLLSLVAPGTAANNAAVMTSRNSYKDCSTGLIVMLLQNGNQTTLPTFTITSAPAGVTVPQTVAVTKATGGSDATGWRYLLANTWPAGAYTMVVNDGCYSATASFKIEELTTVPSGSFSGNWWSTFFTYGDGTDCSKIDYRPYYNYSPIYYPDWYRYFSDGLYEYGIAPTGQMPKTENWFQVMSFEGYYSGYQDLFDLSPGKMSDYFAPGSLTIYTRLKECPSTITSIPANNVNSNEIIYSHDNCTGTGTYTFERPKSSFPYYHTYCYPLTITVTDQATGSVVSNRSDYLFTSPNFSWDCKFGESQYLNITDASGYKIVDNYPMSGISPSDTPTPGFSTLNDYSSERHCDSYDRLYYSTYPCDNGYPNPVYVTVKDNNGTVVHQNTLTSQALSTVFGLKYGVEYTYTFVYPNSNNLTKTLTETVKSTIPTSFTIGQSLTSKCADNTGSLYVRASSGTGLGYMRKGTTVKITGPAGYVEQNYTVEYDGNPSDNYHYFPETYRPPGQYKATIVSCGQTYTATTTITAGYKGDKIGHTLKQDCMGTKLFPSGSISLNGVTQPTVYFRMTKVPAESGANTKVIASSNSNDYFLLTTPGTYILGMMVGSDLDGCAIKLDTIEYNPQPLALDRDKTSAYSCPGGTTGYLTLQATNGTLPYTYSVYDKTNTILLYGPETSSTEIDLGDFGEANETYTVRMSDACGNSFDQQVTLVSLDRTALAYGQEEVCYGSPINVFGFTVTNATYSWTGPNGFTSTEKNAVIPNATKVNEGWYKVKIQSHTCDITVEDSIHVAVYDPVNIAHLDGTTQEITLCPYQALVVSQTASGGSNNFTYQWAYSSNGTNYTNLANETNSTFQTTSISYIFTSSIANPSYRYLRLTVSDQSCGTYNLYYHTNVKGCMYLVNPDLRSPGLP